MIGSKRFCGVRHNEARYSNAKMSILKLASCQGPESDSDRGHDIVHTMEGSFWRVLLHLQRSNRAEKDKLETSFSARSVILVDCPVGNESTSMDQASRVADHMGEMSLSWEEGGRI